MLRWSDFCRIEDGFGRIDVLSCKALLNNIIIWLCASLDAKAGGSISFSKRKKIGCVLSGERTQHTPQDNAHRRVLSAMMRLGVALEICPCSPKGISGSATVEALVFKEALAVVADLLT